MGLWLLHVLYVLMFHWYGCGTMQMQASMSGKMIIILHQLLIRCVEDIVTTRFTMTKEAKLRILKCFQSSILSHKIKKIVFLNFSEGWKLCSCFWFDFSMCYMLSERKNNDDIGVCYLRSLHINLYFDMSDDIESHLLLQLLIQMKVQSADN